MTRISVYDTEAAMLEKYAEEHDMTIAEIIEILVDEYLEEVTK